MQDSGAARLRLFIALPCPSTPQLEAALAELRAAAQDPASGLRIADAATLHVTLRFLGALPTEGAAAVQAALQQLRNLQPPALHVIGAGHFATALWCGVRPDPALTVLAQRCESMLLALGFEPEPRPFIPHVTLARLARNPAFDCKAWADRHRDTHWAELTANCLHLYRSDTGPDRAHYSVLHTVSLGGAQMHAPPDLPAPG